MKICYFGIYDPEFGRNKVYMAGLRALGHEVVECRDSSAGFLKYWRLRRRHAAILRQGGYDAMIVGYPGHLVVPFAKRLAKGKPVVFDALCTLYEAEVLSRGKYSKNPFMRAKIEYIDEAAVQSADIILVETLAQKVFFIKRFALSPEKAERVVRIFTGADETLFNPTVAGRSNKKKDFTVVFRGKFLPEAGLEYVIDAAKLLENQGVKFLILGHGFLQKEVESHIRRVKPKNLEWQSEKQSLGELAKKMAECHVSLGQFGAHERLERTIPHKAFESLALGLPYITARASGVSELLTDGVNCLMTSMADPEDIAAKILKLKNDPELARSLADNGGRLFEEKLTGARLAGEIIEQISRIRT